MSFYDWHSTLSRQTGTNGEICLVIGAKGIGKTFGLRKQCVQDYIRKGWHFCEICRTKEELKYVVQGYFDKLQNEGLFTEYVFKVEKNAGYIALKPLDDSKPDWKVICYFVALTAFQTEKKRTYTNIRRYIFDEAIIDRKDRYHRYLNNEYMILANILDSTSREQPDSDYSYKVYILGNACDLTAPYLRNLGIDTIPDYGYHYYRNRTVLLHYVEPIDSNERQAHTLVGRMLAGSEEASMVFDNVFADTSGGEVARKTSNARFAYGLRYMSMTFGVWIDYSTGIFYINDKVPDKSKIYTLTKSDSTIDYQAVKKSAPYMQILSDIFYLGQLRYSSISLRESFLTVLDFLGVK